jgi:hypothetical protein
MYRYIWNLCITASNSRRLEFILVNSEGNEVGLGTKEDVEALLADVNIKAEVAKWIVEPYRTNYYSDFLGSSDWEDVWQLVWKVIIINNKPFQSLPEQDGMYIESSIDDPTIGTTKRFTKDAPINCLLISDYDNVEALLETQTLIANSDLDIWQQKYKVGSPNFSYGLPASGFPQLYIDLGTFSNSFYQSYCDYANFVLNICEKAGGSVHYQARDI